ncbi:MAG TPA: TIGR00730 family Rossman fold protein [Thermoanaerobaculia bacterium]|nr:TIGR00730 family Rossman fold protein [Thermoanaerobaculia bacterium]
MELTRICVYCGASAARDPAVETEVRVFGREIARRGIGLVYGGSSLGLMGALADEVLASGGKVIGVIPRALVGREAAHGGLTELHIVETMHQREQVMFDLGDAFVTFPGGFGTIKEFLEMVTWKQLGIHGKPVVLANIGGYFDPLLQQLEKVIRSGYARGEDRILYGIADGTKSILTFLEGAPVLERKAGDWA